MEGSMTTAEVAVTTQYDLREHPEVRKAADCVGRVTDFARRRIPAYVDLLATGKFPEDKPDAIKTLGSLIALAGVTPDVLLNMVVVRAIEVNDLSRIARSGMTPPPREVEPLRPTIAPEIPAPNWV
jgi:hypothetical protein